MMATTSAHLPLGRHTRIQTTALDEAEEAAGRVMSAHRLRATRPREFGSRLHAVAIGSSTLLSAVYEGEAEVTGRVPMDYYTVVLVLGGGMDVATDLGRHRIAAGRACVISPGERLHLRFAPRTAQVAAKLPRTVVDQAFSRIGTEPQHGLTFDLRVPDDSPWPGLLRLAASTVDRFDSGVLPPGAAAELERMLVTALLLAQPHDHAEALTRGGGARGHRAAGVVAEAVAADPVAPLRPEELAAAAGVSLRTLQEGFRSRFGTTVTGYQREQRLVRAHRMLSAPTDGATVADIALSCGFVHLGRFAQDYRTRHGITPSATLHGARRAEGRRR
ncbi:AraC family transcriptional regulator [Pseudonocardia xishanensis]|uniref:AraC family transcriptional regulator n=1 Tax=Pseudonocardia xishanensis TaxID=630995 RepID=A0ABP8RE78_9PSEU